MKQTLVLVRGLARETRHWGDFHKQLEEEGFEVLAVDLAGMGEHAKKTPPTSVFGNAEFLRQEVRKIHSGPVGLVAMSFGAMVALEWMQNHPDEITKTMALNTSCRRSSALLRLRWQVWPQFSKLAFMTDTRAREERITQLVVNDPQAQRRAFEEWNQVAKDLKMHPLVFTNQILSASRYLPSAALKGSDRVLIVSSEGDRLVDPSCGQALAEHWQWSLVNHPWGGHDLAWDDPQWLKIKIKSFFS